MATRHRITQGECLMHIAKRYQFHWKTLWDHPDNEELKRLRKDPGVLMPGDIVVVPDKAQKQVASATGASHPFTLKLSKAMIRLRMLCNGEPIKDEPYELTIDDTVTLTGSTDGDGKIEAAVSRSARAARLVFPGRREEHTIKLGHLDPIDQVTGLQARLRQLGYYRGKVDGAAGPKTKEALKAFQKKRGLAESGDVDDATKDALASDYGR
jgi:Putative peptidoglycan binding domain